MCLCLYYYLCESSSFNNCMDKRALSGFNQFQEHSGILVCDDETTEKRILFSFREQSHKRGINVQMKHVRISFDGLDSSKKNDDQRK